MKRPPRGLRSCCAAKGITRIRPLSEGYEGWRKRGFPMSLAKDETGDAEAAKV